MRCFVAASDDEIYAYIERHGLAALVPYAPGMRALRAEEIEAPSPAVEARVWLPEQEPRRAA